MKQHNLTFFIFPWARQSLTKKKVGDREACVFKMTDIQLPLHQAHQKGMNGNGNGKFLAKNTLEM